MEAAVSLGDFLKTFTISDNFSVSEGVPSCGAYQITRITPTLTPAWLTEEVVDQIGGQLHLTVNTNDPTVIGGPYQLLFRVSLVDFPSVPTLNLPVDVMIKSACV